jgi:hypothetical protein
MKYFSLLDLAPIIERGDDAAPFATHSILPGTLRMGLPPLLAGGTSQSSRDRQRCDLDSHWARRGRNRAHPGGRGRDHVA